MNKLLTIVVPVYKVEPYINKCLDSCLIFKTNEQGEKVIDRELMNQMEVIIVNDGTPDQSAEMSREYVKRYPQTFRQIDKENGGHGSAWNVGLKEATGKYLRFLDSDDWLTNLDRLMEKLALSDADLVFTHMQRYYADRNCFSEDKIHDEYGVVKPLGTFDFLNNGQPNVFDFWYVTYKKNVLEFDYDVFSEKTMYDDAVLFVLPAIKAKTYICLDFILYSYFIGHAEQSMSQEKKPKNIVARYNQCIYMDQFWIKHRPDVLDKSIEEGVLKIISNSAWSIFNDALQLPYKTVKPMLQKMGHIFKYREVPSKIYQRFVNMPFFVFYYTEKYRNRLNRQQR